MFRKLIARTAVAGALMLGVAGGGSNANTATTAG